MTIAVNERAGDIGLLRVLGARGCQILLLFLGEATVLAAAGGLAGLLLGVGIGQLLGVIVPALPVHTLWAYALFAEALAASIGLAAGMLSAPRARNRSMHRGPSNVTCRAFVIKIHKNSQIVLILRKEQVYFPY